MSAKQTLWASAAGAMLVFLASCGPSDDKAAPPSGGTPPADIPAGKWTTGDLHTHTTESADADQGQTLDLLLSKAFNTYGLDWLAVTNHLRVSTRDHNGATLTPSVPFSAAMETYEIPRIKALQAAGSYANKLVFSGFEWDMPTHDHIGVGIFQGAPNLVSSPKAANEFEYLFTNRAASMFSAADVAAWNAKYAGLRYYSTGSDALKAISWLKDNYPDSSYAIVNHPSRNKGSYTVEHFRQFHDIAPAIFFALEGMVGNQMEPDRGGYTAAYTPENAPQRTYGGVDYVVAKVGGVWDALLGEGRHIWNVADSDSHFKTTALYSSGYYPGEYAKNYVWKSGDGVQGLLDGLRAGKAFSVFGDLINALDFRIASGSEKKEMGGTLSVAPGSKISITIRFKSPAANNYEKPVNSGIAAGVKPEVDHVDLIAGDVGPRAAAGSAAYSVATNPSTAVVKRFSKADWKVDGDGYYAVTYETSAARSQYYRLRGTNLGVNVANQTVNGEPLADQKASAADNQTRFNDINNRNYASLWFYSNPIFVSVR